VKTFAPAVLAILLAVAVSPLVARADCSKATRETLNIALTSYTQWQTIA